MGSYGRGPPDIGQIYERNQEATVYVGNLDTKTDEELLWEVFTQAGPIKNVHIPRDKVTGMHSNYGFVEFQLETDADYALKIMNMVKLFGKPMRCNKAAQDKRTLEVGANLFIGNLDPEVDDQLLTDSFSSFGNLLSAKVMRDPESGEHRGFGFVAYDAFESSDAALAAMNGQFLCDRPIHVSYAYKKETKGERHGSAAERMLAGNRQTLLKDQQQQQVMANVMSTMMSSIVGQPTPLGATPSATIPAPPPPLFPPPVSATGANLTPMRTPTDTSELPPGMPPFPMSNNGLPVFRPPFQLPPGMPIPPISHLVPIPRPSM